MAGMFDNSIVLEVQQATDIVDVISEHVSLKKKGREMVGLCPFHDDHRPSMNVNPAKQIFKCFSCGAGGDVFKFIQMRENLTFPQAIERLAERANIKIQKKEDRGQWRKPSPTGNTIPGTPYGEGGGQQPEDVDPNRLAKANAWAAEYFQTTLKDVKIGKFARDYVADRGISPESAEKWKLGLAAGSQDGLLRAAKAKKVPLKLLEQAGLIVGHNQDKFVNRLMFTITDVTGRVIGFGGRTLDNSPAKYINSPTTALFDKSNSLYGLEQARHEMVSTGTAVVVEGYTDCMMAHQFGCCNVVATLGTSFTAGHGRMLRRYAKKVILVFDSDVAGVEAANRALDVCLSQRLDIKLASVPEGKDPCDYLLTAGREGFERLLADAADVFQFKWDRLREKFRTDDTLAGRRAAIEEYLETIAVGLQAGRMSAIDFGLRVNQVSKIVGLESRQINAELNRRIRRAEKAGSYGGASEEPAKVDYGQGVFAAAQREVLEVLLNEPALFRKVGGKITPETFDVPVLRSIAAIVFETLEADADVLPREVLARIESVELGKCVVELMHAGQEKGNFEPRLAGALRAIERYETQKRDGGIGAARDQKKYLEQRYENAGKGNPHEKGMV